MEDEKRDRRGKRWRGRWRTSGEGRLGDDGWKEEDVRR